MYIKLYLNIIKKLWKIQYQNKYVGRIFFKRFIYGTETKMDYEKFNLKIAGEFGVGLTKQFIGTNLESTTLNEQDFNYAAKQEHL